MVSAQGNTSLPRTALSLILPQLSSWKSFRSCNNCSISTPRMAAPQHSESNIPVRVWVSMAFARSYLNSFILIQTRGYCRATLSDTNRNQPHNPNLFALGTLLRSLFKTSFYGDRHAEEFSPRCQYHKWLFFYEKSVNLYLTLCES